MLRAVPHGFHRVRGGYDRRPMTPPDDPRRVWPVLAVCSWSLEPRSPQQLVDRVRATSLDRVQLDLLPLLGDPAWSDTAPILADAGIAIESGMLRMAGEDYATLASIRETGGLRPAATYPENLDRARRTADLAAALGIGLVTFHAGFIPEESGDAERAVLLDRLREVAGIFAATGVRVALETGQERAETLAAVLEEVGDGVGVNFDPANMLLYGMGDPVAALARLAPRVLQIHAKDALPSREADAWGQEVPLGEGAVDWQAFLTLAATAAPEAALVIEREAGTHRVADVHQGAALLRERCRGLAGERA
jgi:L-ribulose-5-phosphate 3-epimerase